MAQGAARQLGIVVVGGAGGVGRSAHIPAILRSRLVRLVGVVDTDADRLSVVGRETNCWTSTDLAEALARDDVDIVDICSPDYAHAAQAIAAAQAGKHVLCEKPLALSLDEAEAVREAVRAAGVKFMVAQSMRFHPRWRALKRLVDGIGRPVFARVWTRGRPFDYPPDSFYRRPESIGPIVHNGMHYFDLISWLVGSLPVWVRAAALGHYRAGGGLPGENYWSVQVGFESGALGHVEYNFAALDMPAGHVEQGALVVGESGTAWSAPESVRIVERADRDGFEWPASHPAPGWQDAFQAEIEHFASCVLEAREPGPGLSWSICVLRACLACVESARSGEPVAVCAPSA